MKLAEKHQVSFAYSVNDYLSFKPTSRNYDTIGFTYTYRL